VIEAAAAREYRSGVLSDFEFRAADAARALKEETMAETQRSGKPTTDHAEIRRWAEANGGRPARVKGTGDGNDVGMIRIDFPGYSGEQSLEPITWEEWFEKFDEKGLALIYRDQDRFNKLVSRECADERKAA
jgi:hypothetical protein